MRFARVGWGVVPLLVLFAVSVQAATIQDDFDDGVINPRLWDTSLEGDIVLQETGGVVQTSNSGGYGKAVVDGQFWLLGDFAAQIDYDWELFGGSGHARGFLRVRNEDSRDRKSVV